MSDDSLFRTMISFKFYASSCATRLFQPVTSLSSYGLAMGCDIGHNGTGKGLPKARKFRHFSTSPKINAMPPSGFNLF